MHPKQEFLFSFCCWVFQKNVIKFYSQSKYKECEKSFLCLAEEKTFLKEKTGVGRRATSITTKTALQNTLSVRRQLCRGQAKTVGWALHAAQLHLGAVQIIGNSGTACGGLVDPHRNDRQGVYLYTVLYDREKTHSSRAWKICTQTGRSSHRESIFRGIDGIGRREQKPAFSQKRGGYSVRFEVNLQIRAAEWLSLRRLGFDSLSAKGGKNDPHSLSIMYRRFFFLILVKFYCKNVWKSV